MTSTVTVTAHCGDDTEVRFGITTVPINQDLVEVSTLQNGETATKYIHGERIAVVLERKKATQGA